MNRPRRVVLAVVAVASLLTISATVPAGAVGADREPGYRPTVFAIEHARIVAAPGQVIENGTLVLRDGVIEAVGLDAELSAPFDAERIDGSGLTAYAGFIDAYSTVGIDGAAKRSKTGDGRSIDYNAFSLGSTPPDNRSGMTPEFQVVDALVLDENTARPRRAAGFTSILVAPGGGVATGQSALVSTSGEPRREIVVRSPIALHVAFQPTGGSGYPRTLMGYVAHLRQAMLDAERYEKLWEHYRAHGSSRPPLDPALAALRSAQRGELRVFWQAEERDEILRVLDLAEEFGVSPVIVGGREAWKVADVLAAKNVPVVLRINFPDEPKAGDQPGRRGRRGGFGRNLTPERIREMLQRPDLPEQFRSRLQERLAELQKAPQQPQQREQGEAQQKSKIPESQRVLAERKRLWAEQVACAAVLAEKGVKFCFSTDGQSQPSQFAGNLRKAIEKGLPAEKALAALTRDAAEILGVADRLGTLAAGRAADVVVFDGDFNAEKTKLRYAFVDSDKFEFNKPSTEVAEADENKESAGEAPAEDRPERPRRRSSGRRPPGRAQAGQAGEQKAAQGEEQEAEQGEKQQAERSEEQATEEEQAKPKEPFPTEIEADRKPTFQTGGNVAIRNATVLTVTKGTLSNATLLVKDGKIAAVGSDVEIPKGVHVIDGEGLYVMPGIIDTHSHFAISGGINEGTLSVVPEVRVKDVVNGDDLTIYRALAGGVTAARLLHGSANPIGGQDAVIKLRWGKPGRELIVRDGPQGVKFALGENVKRSTNRYPDTRLGVESTIRRAFDEAKAYREGWTRYAEAVSRGDKVVEPRRDLRLEALADILDGKILIHCHCYRADEILMLLRLAESYGVHVRSLQHVLEGYKVAAEIAAHGASASTFADWWAYKIEAYDAIPYNTALMTRAGVSVCIKSDDTELMRHLYQDAAKMVRYGGLSEQQALATITINPAAQLGLDRRMGSIEVGKDADLAIFNGHPLNGFARCEMTLVDGEVYFERHGEHTASGQGSPIPPEELQGRQLKIPEASSGKYVLTNARIVPIVGDTIENGTLVVADGRIQAIAGGDVPVPDGAEVVDLGGLFVYPGMINASGSLGLTEIGSIRETQDYNEDGTYNPDIRAAVAVNPDSTLIPVSRAGGVLTVLTQPTGGVICGQSVLMNLYGWIPPEMAVVDPCALHMNFPSGSYDSGTSGRQARERVEQLKEQFTLALRYGEIRDKATKNGEAGPVPDPKLEALVPYAKGEKPVVIRAERHGDILAAIEFAKNLKLDWLLAGAADAWKCAEAIKEHSSASPSGPGGLRGVLLGPSMENPASQFDPYDAPYANAATLYKAGVRFAITATSGGPGTATSTRNLPFQAAMAVSYGLPPEEGLRAVTLYPAQLLGVADRLGSIEVSKSANLIVCDGNPLQPATQVKALFIAGKPVAPESKHTRLYARYRRRLEQVQNGKAMLGVSSPQAPTRVASGAGGSD